MHKDFIQYFKDKNYSLDTLNNLNKEIDYNYERANR